MGLKTKGKYAWGKKTFFVKVQMFELGFKILVGSSK